MNNSALIVNGEPLMRLAMRHLLDSKIGMKTCGETSEPGIALQMCQELNPTLLVLDLVLPHGDGIVLIRDMRKMAPRIQVLVITSFEDTETVQRAFKAGASGYITRMDEEAEIVEAICAINKGQPFVSKRVSKGLLGELSRGTLVRSGENRVSTLSDRELQVFRLIGNGLFGKAIASELGVSCKTIETHKQRIKQKLQLQTGSQLSQKATQWIANADKQKLRAARKEKQSGLKVMS